MSKWNWIEQCDKWLYPFNVELVETLVEYEGPHLALLKDDTNKKYFGVFCDFIDTHYRWMLSPISGAEEIAIQTGTVQLIDVFKKRAIWFCDFDDNFESKNVWHAGFESIPSGILPQNGQCLPSFAQRPISDFVSMTENTAIIKLDGGRVTQNSLPFRELGKFLLQFQEYWERLSRSSLVKMMSDPMALDPSSFASLSFCAASEGSVNIHFKPTSEFKDTKKLVLSTVHKLASISETGIPKGLLSELGNAGRENASRMYSMMHSTGIDMLLVTETASLFIGSEKAGRLARSIKKSIKCQASNLIMRGHFCAGRSKKNIHSFEFIDSINGHSYKGKISPIVWRYTAISVGESEFYEVEIETYEKKKDELSIETAYRLVRADKAKRTMIICDPED